MGELAGHTAVGRQIRRPFVPTAGLNGHSHAATTETQVHELGHRQLVFTQHVVTDHTELGLAVSHVGGHIAIAHEQGSGAATGGGEHQLAVVLVQHSRKIQPGGRKPGHRILEKRTFGQRNGDHGSSVDRETRQDFNDAFLAPCPAGASGQRGLDLGAGR